jgi:hypothetical protein
MWLALEDATAANGCMCLLPSSHKDGIARRMVADPSGKVGRGAGGGGGGPPPPAGGAGGRGPGGWPQGGRGGRGAVGRVGTKGRPAPWPNAATHTHTPFPWLRLQLSFTAPQPDYDISQFTPLPCPAGTLLLLHGQNVHYRCALGPSAQHAQPAAWCPLRPLRPVP